MRKTGHTTGLSVLVVLLLASGALNAFASICGPNKNCPLTWPQDNGSPGFGRGRIGPLTLSLSDSTFAADVRLAPGFKVIHTGFPNSFGFADCIGGGLTNWRFPAEGYWGGLSDAAEDLHLEGLGFSDAAAGPSAGNSPGARHVSFTGSDGGSHRDLKRLLYLFNPAGGDALAAVVGNAINTNTTRPGAGRTGLLSHLPEPNSCLLPMLIAFGVLGWVVQRREGAGTN